MRHFTENCSNPDALYNKLNRLIIYSSNETMLFDDKKVFSELVKIGDMLHTGLKLQEYEGAKYEVTDKKLALEMMFQVKSILSSKQLTIDSVLDCLTPISDNHLKNTPEAQNPNMTIDDLRNFSGWAVTETDFKELDDISG